MSFPHKGSSERSGGGDSLLDHVFFFQKGYSQTQIIFHVAIQGAYFWEGFFRRWAQFDLFPSSRCTQ